jgi:tight adherence protein C
MEVSFILFSVLGIATLLAFVGFFVYSIVWKVRAEQRLKKLVVQDRKAYGEETGPLAEVVTVMKEKLKPFAKYSSPGGPWETSSLRQKLTNAGFRNQSAALIYFGAKTVATFTFPIIFLLGLALTNVHFDSIRMMILVLLLCATGYFLPNFALSHLITLRRRDLFENFPDALDLMRVCVEAGLGLDVAISRVGEEFKVRSKALSDEFRQVALEQRAGSTREKAFRNLSQRVGLKDIDALVSTLIQAERFGTSIADALQVHSETLRVERRQRAEEMAAKIPTKILMPLILCIFPILFIIILSPAIVNLGRVFKASGIGQ